MALQGIRIEANTQAAARGIERAHDEAIYLMGFIDGVESVKQKNREQREMRERKRYFVTQRLYGLAALIIAALSAWFSDGDATVALVMVPLGLTLINSRQMLIINRYYWKYEEETEI